MTHLNKPSFFLCSCFYVMFFSFYAFLCLLVLRESLALVCVLYASEYLLFRSYARSFSEIAFPPLATHIRSQRTITFRPNFQREICDFKWLWRSVLFIFETFRFHSPSFIIVRYLKMTFITCDSRQSVHFVGHNISRRKTDDKRIVRILDIR